MLALISPAKKLDFQSEWKVKKVTQPKLLDDAQKLVDILKANSKDDIKKLMKLSDNLAELNYHRYQEFSQPFTKENSRPAITAFKGDTYVGLDADSLSSDDINYAQDHLAILSGLYGLLRPLDLMQAYRLEMGAKLVNKIGSNLYDFWGDTLTNYCNSLVKNHKDKTIVSLASNEYIKSIDASELDGDFITCHFKEMKSGKPKVIGLFAKRARGMMARYIIQKRIDCAEDIKSFSEDCYKFKPSLSDSNNYVFVRG